MENQLSVKLIVRSYELDSLGHVNHAVYLNYFEYGRTEYLNSLGIPFDSFIKEGKFPVMVNINVNYKRPAKLYDELEIFGSLKKMGKSSVTMYQKIINTKTKELICEATGTYVFIDSKTERPILVPDRFKEAFKKLDDLDSLAV